VEIPARHSERPHAVNERLTAALADRYRIERELGAGGMATVYLAQDFRHDRKVALKVLRPELAAVIGAERFLYEIKTTANLQHPHILPLFDSGTVDGTVFYVMPFVQGETLRDRLTREKQLSIDDAVRITREVASALDYAHRHGVIHRDIKPENILLHDGQALVADFGIALAASSAGGSRMTETGMSLGTPHYMSPEQAMGEREITPRSDVYALGCVLYEMLTGDPPFTGSTAQAIVAQVITEDPRPPTQRRKTIPPHVEAAAMTALAKLPADRFATAAQFAEGLVNPGLTWTRTGQTPVAAPAGLSRRAQALVMGALSLVAIAASIFALSARRDAAPPGVGRFALALPPGQELLSPGGLRLAWSPAGDAFVYPGPGSGRSRLWLRRLDSLEAVPIPGSDGATSPIFSPDGQDIAFVTLSPFSVRVIPRTGGQARIVWGDGASGGGLAWDANGDLYADAGTGLARMRPDGSGREIVMPLDTARGESGIAWPSALPGGRGILARIRKPGEPLSEFRIVVQDLRDKSRKELVRGVVARYSDTGHLLWVTGDGTLHAQRFDLDRLELTGAPVVVLSGLAIAGFGATDLTISSRGDLLYVPGVIQGGYSRLVWVGRDGRKTPVDTTEMDGLISDMALSPDGSTVALEILRASDAANLSRIWVKHLSGGPTQLVSGENRAAFGAVWMPGGRELMYASEGGSAIYRRRADGSGGAELVARTSRPVLEMTLPPDGKTIVFRGERRVEKRRELLKIRPGTDTIATPLFAKDGGEWAPALSPDGKWLAYVSTEGGRAEVYVRPFPDVDAKKVQISVEGGTSPHWNPSGGELFYLSTRGDMMAARVSMTPTLGVSSVDRLFTPIGFQGSAGNLLYQVSPEGKRFLMLDITASAGAVSERVVVVQNFAAELQRLLPR
jgi:eukaryotic-like serine/threonine-protein kinase